MTLNNMTIDDINLKYEIVRVYMNKDVNRAIKLCADYINNKKTDIHDDFWKLIFDLFYMKNDRDNFIKASRKYSSITGNLQTAWVEKEEENYINNNNLYIIDGPLNDDEEFKKNFHNFCYHSNKIKFGRLDFNNIDIINSNNYCLNLLLDALYEFKTVDVDTEIILMGDNKIIDFNISIIDDLSREALSNAKTDEEMMILETNHEMKHILFLLKLEILQWKGYEDDYFKLTSIYCDRFNKFPPDYKKEYEKSKMKILTNKSNNGITSVEKFNSFGLTSENDILKYHVKEINKQNLSYMFEYLNGNHDFTIFIDLENVDFFQYEAAIELLMFLNSYRNKKSEYTIYIKNMNKMVATIFEMVGLYEFISS